MKGDDNGRPEGNEVGRKGDENIGFIGHHISTLGAEVNRADAPAADVNKHGVGHFMSQHIEVKQAIVGDSGDEPADHRANSGDEAKEFGGIPDSLKNSFLTALFHEGDGGDEAERNEEDCQSPVQNPADQSEVEKVILIQVIRFCGVGDGCLAGHAAASAIAPEIDLALCTLVKVEQAGAPTGAALLAGAGALVEFAGKSAIGHRDG